MGDLLENIFCNIIYILHRVPGLELGITHYNSPPLDSNHNDYKYWQSKINHCIHNLITVTLLLQYISYLK